MSSRHKLTLTNFVQTHFQLVLNFMCLYGVLPETESLESNEMKKLGILERKLFNYKGPVQFLSNLGFVLWGREVFSLFGHLISKNKLKFLEQISCGLSKS